VSRLKEFLQGLGKIQVAGVVVVLIIVSGFGTAAYINSPYGLETLMKCICQEVNQVNESAVTRTNISGEVDCNTRTSFKPVFHIGLVEISKQCSSKQVYVCEAGEKVDEYYGEESCNYELRTVVS